MDNFSRLILCEKQAQCGKGARYMLEIYESSKDPYMEHRIAGRHCVTAL